MTELTQDYVRGELNLAAALLDDIEKVRIATENRYRHITRDSVDSDGEVRDLAIPENKSAAKDRQGILESLTALEKFAIHSVQATVRDSFAYGLIKREKGLGEKQVARLLASIGDPYWHDVEDRPRTVSELWAYCGYRVDSGVAQRRTKGKQSNWSSEAKMRAFLIAQSCVKATGGRYRGIYDESREKYADAVHPHDCPRCGPAGKPAQAGSALSLGHQHARALRVVAKEILKDLWTESKTAHDTQKA